MCDSQVIVLIIELNINPVQNIGLPAQILSISDITKMAILVPIGTDTNNHIGAPLVSTPDIFDPYYIV